MNVVAKNTFANYTSKSQCLLVHLNKNKNQENKYKSVFILDVEKRHLWIVHHHYHNINYRLEVAVL